MTMVRTIEQEQDRVTSRLYLISIMKWYKDDGIKMGIEKVSNLFDNKNDKNKKGIAVTCSILQEMEKCRVRKIDDKGNVVTKEDEDTGEDKVVTEVVDDVEEVTFFFNVNQKGVDAEKGEFKVNNLSSCFPLFNFAFIQSGDLPEGNEKGFICDIDELKEALEGLEFIGKAKYESFNGGKKYPVLLVEDIPIKKEVVTDDDEFEDE